jgi:hypothetical protein
LRRTKCTPQILVGIVTPKLLFLLSETELWECEGGNQYLEVWLELFPGSSWLDTVNMSI